MDLLGYFKRMFHKRSRIEVEILQGIDIEHMFTSPQVAEDIRNRVQEHIHMKKALLPQYEKNTNELTLVQKIDQLPREELAELETMAKLYSDTLIEKDASQRTLRNESNASKYLERYKDDIKDTIAQLKENEEMQSIIKNDLNILEGEKADIHYRNTRAQFALKFLKMFLIVMIFATAVAALILTTLFFIYNVDIFIPSVVIMVVVSFTVLWIYIFRRYLVHEVKRNQKLQKRQVELTNKTKIKYVNIQQYLDYGYNKYQVNSSEMLELRWENFQQHTINEARFKRISNSVATMMQDVDRLLSRNNIEGGAYVTDRMDYFSSRKGRKMLQNAIELERQDLKAAIDSADNDILVLSRLLEEIMDHD